MAWVGTFVFGLVVGWITYRTLRRREGAAALSDISSVIGAVGGGAVTALFKSEDLFGLYALGLGIGFFLYLIVSMSVYGKESSKIWMGD
jgi:uncharacterized membrane protein YeaQ/YmgE (transglycosylase-associated protein family)